MLPLRVQAHQYVILVRSTEKQSAKLQRSLGEIGFRLESLKIFLIFYCEDNDRRARVDLCFRKCGVKDRAHALELIGDTATLLFVCVGNHYKVRAGDLDPTLGFVACRSKRGGGTQEKQQNSSKHNGRAHTDITPAQSQMKSKMQEFAVR